MRRDSLHATINGLPDPNYATLRALTLVSDLDCGIPRNGPLIRSTASQPRSGAF